MKQGKILKIRLGHEANCSSGMILIAMFFASAVTHLPTAAITSGIQARQAKRNGEISKMVQVISQIIGLVFTVLLFFYGVLSGYSGAFLGLMALMLGAGFAIAVFIGGRLAPKIGYWNILAVPLIQVGLIFVLFWILTIIP